ncbi:uncharacterized protein MONBRDRAFT_17406 [Monosiga brevicollis MX1]|uniref:6-phosphofructokinase n=2 Tax=Monosiga brevicollis TaxID=81824 RepID=A9UR21_MONBE|nr:uncharacterized protein MONBRDRAFT_17406 [Monosiga brevicollis MX1]EDQ92699.1 predicted protein [Monosiga brevicollis MX1]|eukprot:XP_001742461.1 hypothetical protein [Monosiga brevicollis MX1]
MSAPGGDAQGMNAAVRAAAATCLTYGVSVYAIYYGYQGMVDGGENIKKLDWKDISNISQIGGTVIGSARCQDFRTHEGRLKAAFNLVKNDIDCLIAIGGDGTLTGANMFKQEWPSLLRELQASGQISEEAHAKHEYLSVVGMVGSIDNDMCGFSMTIGCDSALNRICEAIDALTTTAQSHQRTFIIEVMGRNCGFLALMAALTCGADYVLLPEHPPEADDWEAAMCDSLKRRRRYTNFSLIVLAEGATDKHRNHISGEYVKKVCSERLGYDTRVTTLGHVQRGGAPSVYDRILATRCGAEAALAVLNATHDTPARIVGTRWTQMIQVDLTEAVERTREVGAALEAKDYDRVMELRGRAFREELNLFFRIRQHHQDEAPETPFNVLVMQMGAPAAGMNAACKAVVRDLINGGHKVYGAVGALEGIANGDLMELRWDHVKGWASKGGAALGTNRTMPDEMTNGMARIAEQLRTYNIHGIMAVGGFEAYTALGQLVDARDQHEEFCIPISLVPATISNNVPGTSLSLGSDTALNTIVDAIDRLKQSALSSRKRLFIVETQGAYCGYLASMGALAGAADAAYLYEERLRIDDLIEDVDIFRRKFEEFHCAVIVRNENSSKNYDMAFLKSLFTEEGSFDETRPAQVQFTCRDLVLGHLLQGGSPSPLDRLRGARLGAVCTRFLIHHMTEGWNGTKVKTCTNDSACVIGIKDRFEVATPFSQLKSETDFKLRKPKSVTNRGVHALCFRSTSPFSFSFSSVARLVQNVRVGQCKPIDPCARGHPARIRPQISGAARRLGFANWQLFVER